MAGPQRADGTGGRRPVTSDAKEPSGECHRCSPAGTTIEVALTATEGGTRVDVPDRGRVLDEAHRQSITELSDISTSATAAAALG